MRKRFINSRSESTILKLQQSKHELDVNVLACKAAYENNIIQEYAFTHKGKIFDYIKSLCGANNIPPKIQFKSEYASTDTGKTNLFNAYFYSVFNRSDSTLPAMKDLPIPIYVYP